jgi:hypothetical protein
MPRSRISRDAIDSPDAPARTLEVGQVPSHWLHSTRPKLNFWQHTVSWEWQAGTKLGKVWEPQGLQKQCRLGSSSDQNGG